MARSVHLFNFHGIQPKLDESLLNAAGAMLAENVDLSRGDLEPFKEKPALTNGQEAVISAAPIEDSFCLFKTWDEQTDYDWGKPDHGDSPPLYWIEDNQILYSKSHEICHDIGHVLGVEAPDVWPIVTQNNPEEKGCETVAAFCYTNLNADYHESAPSPPSPVFEMGVTVSVDIELPLAPVGTVRRRIYRTMAGASTGTEQAIVGGGEWVLVAEVGTNAGVFRTPGLESAVQTLPSTRWDVPPYNPECLAFIASTNTLMVGEGNTVRISQPGIHYAFPNDRDVTLKDRVVAIREYDGDVIVLTDGHPYILMPIKEREGAPHYEVLRAEEAYPCLSKASVAVGTTGVIWASTDGIFVIGRSRAGLTVQSISSEVFYVGDWEACDPTTIRGEVYNSAYYFTADNPVVNSITGEGSQTWILSYDETVYQNPTNVHMSSLSIVPSMWQRSRKDKLYYAIDGDIYEWNPVDGTPMTYNYISRDIVEVGLTNYSVAKVVHDGDGPLTFELYRELGGKSVKVYSRAVTHSEPFRLPRSNLSVDHYIQLTGSSRVRRIHLASSYDDLTLAKDTTITHGNTRVTAR